MSIKAIMVDVDGVLIVHPNSRGWSVNLESDLGLNPAVLQSAFFAEHWDEIIHGRARLRERLASVLQNVAPDVTCDALINYWFTNDAHLNSSLLDELAPIRACGVELHLATVQEHERATFLWQQLNLQAVFDGIHYAAELGCSKPAAEFFTVIERRTGWAASEIFFIDDKMSNVEAARNCGWTAELWTGDKTLRSLLGALV